ncbi:hypothetical protein LTR97_003743 [Elasticomyces elasticus]|uniref:Uncharacterized protein n=1 Tax=Elasticomyces elasticus TaxID=574655 RepID=A0AAN7ZPC2_9PEZI|nr:hypothetical protein LTR97_003743 [Elasticomyces elasticus]
MSIMDDSKTLISELIAVALTWTDETSQRDPQKDQQLVLKLHNVLQKERTTAATEALRLKALLAKTDNDDPADGELAEENARLKTELAEARQEQEAIRRLLSGSASKETSTASFERPSTAQKCLPAHRRAIVQDGRPQAISRWTGATAVSQERCGAHRATYSSLPEHFRKDDERDEK